ncbi:MAG: hypothetical protein M3Y87_32295 [Myxococcota bacterium]|nr:hypothetical protein [Myxococcota bacterium]
MTLGALTYGALATCALALCGCAPEPPPSDWPLERIVGEILEPSCGQSGCHSHPEPAQGLDLSSADAVLRTAVGRSPTIGSASGLYPAIVVPGDPERSFLIAKVTLPGADEGLPMPPNEWMLTEEAVEVLREWIATMPAERAR